MSGNDATISPARKRRRTIVTGEKLDKAAGPAELRVWLRLLSVTMMLEKRLRRRFADQFGTTLPRFDIMAALDRQPDGLTMSALSQALLVSNGNVTAIVRQLEKEGLVETRAVMTDRRSSIAVLTAAGQTRFGELAAAHHGWIAEAFATLPGAHQTQLYRLLGALKQAIGRTG